MYFTALDSVFMNIITPSNNEVNANAIEYVIHICEIPRFEPSTPHLIISNGTTIGFRNTYCDKSFLPSGIILKVHITGDRKNPAFVIN